MLTVVHVWLASSFVFAVVLTIDQMRRPVAAWQAAGRERRFWVTLTLVLGFHGLGPYAAAAYLAGVVPRFRAAAPAIARPRPAVQWLGSSVALRRDGRTATEALALVAALLVFGSSFIHTALIADHMAYWVPFGVAFAVVTCGQAVWAALVYRDPLNPRLLVAGAVGNGAVVVVWAISRTAGMPVGPQPGAAEPVGVADSFATLDAAHGRRPDRVRPRRVARHADRGLGARRAARLGSGRAAVHLEHPRGVRRGALALARLRPAQVTGRFGR